MRVVIPVLVVVVALALALVVREPLLLAPDGAYETPRYEVVAPAVVPAARMVAAMPASTSSPPSAPAVSVSPGPAAALPAAPFFVSVPPPLMAAAEAPDTLELVSLPTILGAKPATPRTISRAAAVASVIASPTFQETVTPLARLYLATHGRFPDYEGINYYTGQREEARPLVEIADEFVSSYEFRLRYGELDDTGFVERIFLNVLGNPTQADALAYWVGELESGRMTRGQVLIDLAESAAFRERSANQVFVSTAYLEILHRSPDPEGFARWVAHLNAGNPYRSVIDGLLAGR
jgi:hypothetical protein